MPRLTPRELEDLYDSIPRVSLERSDFLLPQVIDFVQSKRWINIRPEYQRRLVWDRQKKSRFIESLLMNIPIPPIFLYEHELSRYEVMDGQQRINAILEFYDNDLKLSGLDTWAALNGLTRKNCPDKILRGLDRRRLSATVLLAESVEADGGDADRLRREVFERLNTGGQKLNAQELRNSLYGGPFNKLLIDLAGNPLFDDIWGIPRYDEHYNRDTGHIGAQLSNNNLFRRMTDCELVLRFFAFREEGLIRGSVKSILDSCMEKYCNCSEEEAAAMAQDFREALELANKVFGKRTFQLHDEMGHWRMSQPLYDAVMVNIHRFREREDDLLAAKAGIVQAVQHELADEEKYEVIVGRPNTAKAVKQRIAIIHTAIEGAMA